MASDPKLQAHWDSVLAAEGLAPINVVSVSLRAQVLSGDEQERYFRLADMLETGYRPPYLTPAQFDYWQSHWRQRLPNADLARYLAEGGFARQWQRERGGPLKRVHRRVEVLRKLCGFLRLEAAEGDVTGTSLQTEILAEFVGSACVPPPPKRKRQHT